MADISLNDAARRAWDTCEAKGFHEEWDDADFLEHVADELDRCDNPVNGWVEEADTSVAGKLRQIAESHRIMTLMTKLALTAGEIVGEAADELRKNGLKGLDKEAWSSELADGHIRLLDLSSLTGVDIGDAVKRKMDKNDGRQYKHGKVF
jgi:NTP pyrophosphatase (non-canonical NTP hydrolase)